MKYSDEEIWQAIHYAINGYSQSIISLADLQGDRVIGKNGFDLDEVDCFEFEMELEEKLNNDCDLRNLIKLNMSGLEIFSMIKYKLSAESAKC